VIDVCLIAAPLTARSGVYRSTIELVVEARRRGLPWSALLGVSARAGGAPPSHPRWIVERRLEPRGPGGVRRLRAVLDGEAAIRDSSLVLSLAPQTDMALATTGRRWVAYLRGLPWPDRGESAAVRRWGWRACETVALQRAERVWATTPTLQAQVRVGREIELVPPGIEPVPRRADGSGGSRLVWAARFDHDKHPEHFVRLVSAVGVDGVMFGMGPLREHCAAIAPPQLQLPGWATPGTLWSDALAYVGTSRREAFGRSAVEAAMTGIPVVLSEAFGVSRSLYTDDELAARFVLRLDDGSAWRRAVTDLRRDRGLRRAVSDHVHANASRLTVDESVSRIAALTESIVGADAVASFASRP
jgi:glycosyltransferase involved in cell wall biosynthesis